MADPSTPAEKTLEVKPEPNALAPSSPQQQPPSSQHVPEWISRVRNSLQAEDQGVSGITDAGQGQNPAASELNAGSPDDWLENLRTAAADEQKPQTEETAPVEAAVEPSIPQWFTDVLPASPSGAGTPSNDLDTPAVQDVDKAGGLSAGQGDPLPDWLVELQGAALDQPPSRESSANQDVAQTSKEKADEDMPQWLKELQSMTPADQVPSSLTVPLTPPPQHKPEALPPANETPALSRSEATGTPAPRPLVEEAARPNVDTPALDGGGVMPGPATGETGALNAEAMSGLDEPVWLKELRSKMDSPPQPNAMDATRPAEISDSPQLLAQELSGRLAEDTNAHGTGGGAPEHPLAPESKTEVAASPGPPEGGRTAVELEVRNNETEIPAALPVQDSARELRGLTQSEANLATTPKSAGTGLPEWLLANDEPAQEGPIESPASDGARAESLPDWLKEFGPEINAAKAVLSAEPAAEVAQKETRGEGADSGGVESRPPLSDAAQTVRNKMESAEPKAAAQGGPPASQEEDAEQLPPPDWVRELSPPSDAEVVPSALDQSDLEALPDWLREVEPLGADKKHANAPAPSSIEGLPGWIEQLNPPLEELTESAGPLAGVIGVLPNAFAGALQHPIIQTPAARPSGAQVFESVLAAASTAPIAAGTRATTRGTSPVVNRLIYLGVLLAAVVALLIPGDLSSWLGLAVNNATPTAGFYDRLHSLAPGATVLLSFDYDPGQAVELTPAVQVVVRDLAQRHINVIALTTVPAGSSLAQSILKEEQSQDWQPGKNFVNIGMLQTGGAGPGTEAALKNLAENGLPAGAVQPLTASVKSLRDVAIVIEITGADASLRAWMEQVQPQHETTFLAVVSAAVESSARNYRDAKQLAAFLRGMNGAAEYELFLNQTGVSKPTGSAVRLVDAQSILHLVLFGLIVLGNLVLVFDRARRKGAPPAPASV